MILPEPRALVHLNTAGPPASHPWMRWCTLLLVLRCHDLADELADDRVDVRAKAEARIVRLGVKASPDLRALLSHPDPEVAARASHILARLAAPRLVLGDGTTASFPKDRPLSLLVVMDNPWGEPVFLHRDGVAISIVLRELHGDPPQPSLDEPAIFFPEARESECGYSASDFVQVAAGESFRHRLPDIRSLAFVYGAAPAGRYRIRVRYAFDPAAYRRRCSKKCAEHDAPGAPWNLAPTAPLETSAEFTLR